MYTLVEEGLPPAYQNVEVQLENGEVAIAYKMAWGDGFANAETSRPLNGKVVGWKVQYRRNMVSENALQD